MSIALRTFRAFAFCYQMHCMKDIDEIRRDNLRLIERQFGGSTAAVARMVEMSPSQFANLREGAKDSKTGKRRGMRKETARRIEAAVGKPDGWLDVDHSTEVATELGGFPPVSIERPIVTIRQYDTGGAMGAGGVELHDQPGVIESWRVSRDWIEQNVRGYGSVESLCLVTGFGDSMKPLFNPGDPLIIDASVKTVEFDAVYFFRVDNQGFIKRLQRVPGQGLLAISENRAYRDWVIDSTMSFEVFGRVLKVWRSEEF
ncbi:peptidase S24-like protein [Bordetella bronchiseptica MBORD595]|nr:peptidase S24-like protein [Bordetella bronchiseptica MBORD595]